MGRFVQTAGQLVVCLALVAGSATRDAAAQAPPELAETEQCRPPLQRRSAQDLLDRASDVIGLGRTDVLQYNTVERTTQDFQSDRTYAPFFSAFDVARVHFVAAEATEYRAARFLYPMLGPTPEQHTAITAHASWRIRGGEATPSPRQYGILGRKRSLNPHAVVADWLAAEDVEAGDECYYRDDWRLTLRRAGPFGRQRLFLDRESGFPVKLDALEPHATWGQRHVEALWSTWQQFDDTVFPTASFLLLDGEVNMERTVGEVTSLTRAEVDLASLPGVEAMERDPWMESITRIEPDTVRVGANTFVLAQPMYNEAVTLVGDTVYVLDATMTEARAAQDQAWIETLFPDHRHVRVVVTDLAWPHFGGVRFWVAQGAEIIAHDGAEDFLRRVVERPWTRWPDTLERRRGTAELRFTPFSAFPADDSRPVRLLPLEGIGNEGSLVVHVASDDFLWAGDWIQDAENPTTYASDVVRAAGAAAVRPGSVAAQHLPLQAWDPIAALNADGGSGSR